MKRFTGSRVVSLDVTECKTVSHPPGEKEGTKYRSSYDGKT
jgi:hypothetical protein